MKKWLVIFLLLCATLFATEEIRYYSDTGEDRYVRIIDTSTFYAWDTTTTDFNEIPIWANSAVDLTEDSNIQSLFYADFPPTASAGYYDIIVYVGTASGSASTDTALGGFDFAWDGSAEITPYTNFTDVNAVGGLVESGSSDANAIGLLVEGVGSDVNDVSVLVDTAITDVNAVGILVEAIIVDVNGVGVLVEEGISDVNSVSVLVDTAITDVNAVGVLVEAIDTASAADVNSSLVYFNLDHFLITAVSDGNDMTTEIVDGTIFSNIMTAGGDTSDFVRSTDSLEGKADTPNAE